MSTAGCSSEMGPGGDADQERKNVHLNVQKSLRNIYGKPYDDIIFSWCDGDASRGFSDVKIEMENRYREPNISVRLRDLYDTSVVEECKMPEYVAFLDFLKGSDRDAEALSQVFDSKASEAEVVVALAVHLFAKLAPKSRVLVDINIQDRPNECPCRCGGTYEVDHLGFGSGRVWHGRPDMEIGSVIVSVAKEDDLEDEDDEDGPSATKKQKEDKNSLGISRECKKGSISTMDTICQTAAQGENSYPPSSEDRLAFFPTLPQRLVMAPMRQIRQRIAVDVEKESYKHPKLTPDIFTVFCPHGVCYGFQAMTSAESPKVPFSIFKTRFKKAPSVIVYDNACNLHKYCLNREPEFFKSTRFYVDTFHWKGHVSCSEGYCLELHKSTLDTVLIKFTNKRTSKCWFETSAKSADIHVAM